MRSFKSNTIQRKNRTRTKIRKTTTLPRLSVFRSNKYIYAQVIDDSKGHTLASADAKDLKLGKEKKTKMEIAGLIGEEIAKKALSKKITEIVFDRAGYKYHGLVKTLAEGARKGGLKF